MDNLHFSSASIDACVFVVQDIAAGFLVDKGYRKYQYTFQFWSRSFHYYKILHDRQQRSSVRAAHGDAFASESHEKPEEIYRPVGIVHDLRTNQMASIDWENPRRESKPLTSELTVGGWTASPALFFS